MLTRAFAHENSVTMSNQVYGSILAKNFTAMQLAADGENFEFSNQVQKPQSASNGANQRTLEVQDDRNQRYQSMLQFAANHLFQIQQKQQQFRSVDEARHAKKDCRASFSRIPRFQLYVRAVMLVEAKIMVDFRRIQHPRTDLLFNDQLANMLMRPFGPQGSFESPYHCQT